MGPHLDDIELYLNNRSLESFGSVDEYECRIAFLCLKLAESEMITEKTANQLLHLLMMLVASLMQRLRMLFTEQ